MQFSETIWKLLGKIWMTTVEQYFCNLVENFESSNQNRIWYLPSWAWWSPWGQVLFIITFCQIPVLSWAIRYLLRPQFSSYKKLEPTSIQKSNVGFSMYYKCKVFFIIYYSLKRTFLRPHSTMHCGEVLSTTKKKSLCICDTKDYVRFLDWCGLQFFITKY